MGNYFNKEPPPPVVLVPPLFDFPPLAARTRMLESSYNMLFGKLGLKCLFEDYFEEARHFNTIFMLKPIDDPNVDMMATLSGPFNIKPEERIAGNASFRWQNDVDDPHTFMDLFVSNSDPVLRMRSCTYFPRYGFGVFGILPLLLKKRVTAEDYGVMGLRYGSGWLSAGVTVMPFAIKDQLPRSAWLVSKLGRLTFGVQYEPQYGSEDEMKYKNKLNWSCAIGYGVGSGCPLSPSFTFGLELAKSSQVCSQFNILTDVFHGELAIASFPRAFRLLIRVEGLLMTCFVNLVRFKTLVATGFLFIFLEPRLLHIQSLWSYYWNLNLQTISL